MAFHKNTDTDPNDRWKPGILTAPQDCLVCKDTLKIGAKVFYKGPSHARRLYLCGLCKAEQDGRSVPLAQLSRFRKEKK